MAYLQRSPANVEDTWKYDIKCILALLRLTSEATEQRNETADYENQPSNVPGLPLPYLCFNFIRKNAYNWSGNPIANLSS